MSVGARFLITIVILIALSLNNSIKRKFIALPGAFSLNKNYGSPPATFRILQLNVLADGLSGLRSDLGLFSRASKEVLDWNTRKYKLLNEIVQYEPDIITM